MMELPERLVAVAAFLAVMAMLAAYTWVFTYGPLGAEQTNARLMDAEQRAVDALPLR